MEEAYYKQILITFDERYYEFGLGVNRKVNMNKKVEMYEFAEAVEKILHEFLSDQIVDLDHNQFFFHNVPHFDLMKAIKLIEEKQHFRDFVKIEALEQIVTGTIYPDKNDW